MPLQFVLTVEGLPFYDASEGVYKLVDPAGKGYWLNGNSFTKAEQKMIQDYKRSGMKRKAAVTRASKDILTVWDTDMDGIYPEEKGNDTMEELWAIQQCVTVTNRDTNMSVELCHDCYITVGEKIYQDGDFVANWHSLHDNAFKASSLTDAYCETCSRLISRCNSPRGYAPDGTVTR